MRRLTDRPLLGWLVTTAAFVTACGLFDPLDQPGLYVVMSPPDTAVYVDASFTAHALMVNSYGDRYPSTHFEYSSLDPSITAESNGTVTGLTYGRARLVATRADFADTGWVSVVPQGTVAMSLMAERSRVDVVSTDGSGLTTIVETGQIGGGSPAWLPGNAGLVYQCASIGGAGHTQLFVTDFAGHSRLLAVSGNSPRIARDGSWVYFHDDGRIWRVHVDGTGLELVLSSAPIVVADPDPSPDGTQLAFIRHRYPTDGGFPFQIEIRTLAGGTDRLLVASGLRPRWSPSGDSLAFWQLNAGESTLSQNGAIFVIGADGTGLRQVSAPGRDYSPDGLDWSPDGQWLLARADSTVDVIGVATGLTLPLGYSGQYSLASWQR